MWIKFKSIHQETSRTSSRWSSSKSNIILSYLIVLFFFGSGFQNPNYLEINKKDLIPKFLAQMIQNISIGNLKTSWFFFSFFFISIRQSIEGKLWIKIYWQYFSWVVLNRPKTIFMFTNNVSGAMRTCRLTQPRSDPGARGVSVPREPSLVAESTHQQYSREWYKTDP